jgi:isopentenyldiphosphate isomerase
LHDYEEILDLVDANDQVITTVVRGEYYKDPSSYDGYVRASSLLIRNDKGQLWIPRRTADRTVAPNALDYSCGGHVSSGETYLDGLIHEAAEELRMNLVPEDVQLLKLFTPTPGDPYFMALYLCDSNDTPDYNPEDFQEYTWLSPRALIARLQKGEPAKRSLLPTILEVIDHL